MPRLHGLQSRGLQTSTASRRIGSPRTFPPRRSQRWARECALNMYRPPAHRPQSPRSCWFDDTTGGWKGCVRNNSRNERPPADHPTHATHRIAAGKEVVDSTRPPHVRRSGDVAHQFTSVTTPRVLSDPGAPGEARSAEGDRGAALQPTRIYTWGEANVGSPRTPWPSKGQPGGRRGGGRPRGAEATGRPIRQARPEAARRTRRP
jgi:hypothetical protein